MKEDLVQPLMVYSYIVEVVDKLGTSLGPSTKFQ